MIWIYTVLILTTLIVFVNLCTAQRIRSHKIITHEKVSIIIPARNEAASIGSCVSSYKHQSFAPHEIIVVDDESTDETAQLARRAGAKVIKGKKLPKGWIGKNHACYQGAQKATGDILLFTDADVQVTSQFLKRAIETMKYYKLGMLSCFPQQLTGTIGEKLVVPIMKWFLLATLPLRLVMLSKWTSLSAANGQCLLFTKAGYKKIGGWEAIKGEIIDDGSFVKRAKRKNVRRATTLSADISCRMYTNIKEAYAGFGKNFFPGTGMHVALFIFLILLLAAGWFVPLFFGPLGWILLYAQRILLALTIRSYDVSQFIFAPLQPLIFVSVALYSIYLTKTGTRTWKGRTL